MSDLGSFRFTANAVRERARVQHESGVLDDTQHTAIVNAAGTLDRILDDFDRTVSHDRSVFLPERLAERVAVAAGKAREAMRPVEAARDAAIREAADYAEHASTIERNPDGVTFRPRKAAPEPSALDIAALTFLWQRIATADPGDIRRQYAIECGKGPSADTRFLRAVETCPLPDLLDEDTKRIARDARVRALGLTSYQQARDSVAAALTLVVDAAHAVVSAVAGGAAGTIRRASDDASIDVRIA
jgi:hypothetical protein